MSVKMKAGALIKARYPFVEFMQRDNKNRVFIGYGHRLGSAAEAQGMTWYWRNISVNNRVVNDKAIVRVEYDRAATGKIKKLKDATIFLKKRGRIRSWMHR